MSTIKQRQEIFHQARLDPTCCPFDIIKESLELARINDADDQYLCHSYLSSLDDYFVRARAFDKIAWQETFNQALKTRDLIGIVLARRHGKSEKTAESFPAYYAMAFPYSLIGIFSESTPMSKTRLRNIKRQIIGQRGKIRNGKRNPFYNFYKYNKGWSTQAIVLANETRIEVAGSVTGVRGGREGDERYNLLIIDDPVPEQVGKDEAIIKWFKETIANLGQAGTIILLIGTPRRYGDIIVELLENAEEQGMYLIYVKVSKQYPPSSLEQISWPERWLTVNSCCLIEDSPCAAKYDPLTRAVAHMEAHRKFIGSLAWAREYMCEPIADGTALFPQSLIETVLNRERCLGRVKKPGSIRVLGVDPAASPEADSFAGFIVLEIDIDKEKYAHYTGYKATVIHVEYISGVRFETSFLREQLAIIINLHKIYDLDAIGIEDNSYQAMYHDLIKETHSLPVYLITTTGDKHNLETGLPSIRQWLENGFLELPYKDEGTTREKMGRLIREMRGFQFESGKVLYNGLAHGDLVMALLKAKEVYHLFTGSQLTVIGSIDSEQRTNYYG